MGTQAGSVKREGDGAGRRGAKIVAAVRVMSIDYRPIVDKAVAGLVRNTPDARREVYAQAREIVKRHLQLMRLPEPLVELEKLSLDLTIRKIERRWRLEQAAEVVVHAVPTKPDVPRPMTAAQAFATLGVTCRVFARALAALFGALGMRPVGTVLAVAMKPLWWLSRGLFSPVGLAAVLPITVIAVFIVLFVDNNLAYNSVADGPIGRWIARLNLMPAPATAMGGSKSTARIEPAHPLRAAALPAPELRSDDPPPPPTRDVSQYRSPTKVHPIRADFAGVLANVAAAAPASPALDASPTRARLPAPCPDPSAADPVRCAPAAVNPVEASIAANRNDPPQWLSSYATLSELTAPPRPVGPPPPPVASVPTAIEVPAVAAAPPVAATLQDAEPDAASVGAPLPTAPAAISPITTKLPAANAKVAALMDSGRRAAVKGDLDRAVADFSEAIRIDPKYPVSYSERGQALFKLGETDRAIADYSAAIKRDPQFGAALRARGMAYLYRGANDLALADLSRAIKLAEDDPSVMAPIEVFYARRSRATINGNQQQYDLEIVDCTALIDSYMQDPSVGRALNDNYHEIGAANIIATIYRQRANGYIKLSKFELAIADLSAAVPLSSDGGFSALMDRAKLHESMGLRQETIADLQAALDARPGSEEVRIALRRLGAPARPALPRPIL
jgi:tetratricopeptide (TPR) repeat protein